MYVKSLFCQIAKNLTKFNNPYDFAVGISIIRADPKCCNIGTGVDQDQNHGTLLNTKNNLDMHVYPYKLHDVLPLRSSHSDFVFSCVR